jgi:hypothetical protein
LVRAKSIPETVSVTHVSSAFLLVTAVAGSDVPTVANSMKPQVVVRATRVCLIARIKRTTNTRFSIWFSAMTRGSKNRPHGAPHQKG